MCLNWEIINVLYICYVALTPVCVSSNCFMQSPGSRDSGGGSVLKSVNKSTVQFKKSRNRRSGSPINWTPLKESYMKRKIKHLQVSNK